MRRTTRKEIFLLDNRVSWLADEDRDAKERESEKALDGGREDYRHCGGEIPVRRIFGHQKTRFRRREEGKCLGKWGCGGRRTEVRIELMRKEARKMAWNTMPTLLK